MIIMTHANREFDEAHTSWTEIIAFTEILEKELNEECLFLDKNTIQNHNGETPSSLFIFTTGSIDDQILDFINYYSNTKIYVVLQDPNWRTIINLDRPYTLITPFKKLENQSLDKALNMLMYTMQNNLILNTNHIEKHIYLPFGNMLSESQFYQDLLNDDNQVINFSQVSNQLYIGSLKADRAHQFKEIAYDTDFIGNFDKNQFENLTNLSDLRDEQFKGRLPVLSYCELAEDYDRQLMMPDKKMIDLDVSYIRQQEVYFIDIPIKMVLDNQTNQHQAHKHMSNFSYYDIESDAYEADGMKALKYYGIMSEYIKNNLQGVV